MSLCWSEIFSEWPSFHQNYAYELKIGVSHPSSRPRYIPLLCNPYVLQRYAANHTCPYCEPFTRAFIYSVLSSDMWPNQGGRKVMKFRLASWFLASKTYLILPSSPLDYLDTITRRTTHNWKGTFGVWHYEQCLMTHREQTKSRWSVVLQSWCYIKSYIIVRSNLNWFYNADRDVQHKTMDGNVA